jgi:hypothetical protein
VYSPNGVYVLHLNPKTRTHAVCATANSNVSLWSFSKEYFYESPIFLSNDGKVVAILAWKYMNLDELDEQKRRQFWSKGKCIQFWNSEGEFKSYQFAELCPTPQKKDHWEGPIGDNGGIWFTQAIQEDDTFRVQTTDSYEYTFSLKNGSILEKQLILKNQTIIWIGWLSLLFLISLASIIEIFRRKRRNQELPQKAS